MALDADCQQCMLDQAQLCPSMCTNLVGGNFTVHGQCPILPSSGTQVL